MTKVYLYQHVEGVDKLHNLKREKIMIKFNKQKFPIVASVIVSATHFMQCLLNRPFME